MLYKLVYEVDVRCLGRICQRFPLCGRRQRKIGGGSPVSSNGGMIPLPTDAPAGAMGQTSVDLRHTLYQHAPSEFINSQEKPSCSCGA